jgi:hypothetical protein
MDTTIAFISAALQPGEIIIAILHGVWLLILVLMVVRVCGNCELLVKSLVLLIRVGLNPAVFLS